MPTKYEVSFVLEDVRNSFKEDRDVLCWYIKNQIKMGNVEIIIHNIQATETLKLPKEDPSPCPPNVSQKDSP